MTDDDAVLVGSGVSHAFGDVDVLDDVSLSVESGTVTALIGPNGSGKTTLLRILTGILEPTSGTVTYRGTETGREIGYMPQEPAFRHGFTARETLEFYTSFVGGDPAELLDRVGLGESGDRRVEALSGGMRRLLGIAQATVGVPPVVVLDEPGSGLDPGMRRQTYEVVRDLAADGTAVLLSSHDMAFTERFADRVVVLHDGQVTAQGPPADLSRQFDVESLQAVFERVVSPDADDHTVAGDSG